MVSVNIIEDILNRCLSKDEVSVHCIDNPSIAELEDYFGASVTVYNNPRSRWLVVYQGSSCKPADTPCIVMHDALTDDDLYIYDVENPI